MADNNKFYQNYFEKKYTDKEPNRQRSYAEQMFPVFVSAKVGSVLIHVLSFLMASIYPAYWMNKSLGVNGGIAFVGSLFMVGFCIFLFIEVNKYTLTKVVVENRHNKEAFSHYWAETIALVLIICGSVFLSTKGSEIVDDYFNPTASVINLVQLEENYDSVIEQKIEYWDKKINAAQKDVKEYWVNNKRYYASEGKERLSSAKSIQQPYKLLQSNLANLISEKSKELAELRQYKRDNINTSKETNEQSISEHKAATDFAGTVLFWFMLLLEIIYIGLIYFVHYYNYRAIREREDLEVEEKQSEGEERAKLASKVKQYQSEAKKSKEREEPVLAKTQQPQRRPIKFGNESYQHGQIVMQEGWNKPKMAYKKANGDTSFYTQSKLLRMARDNKASEERKEALNNLANQKGWEQY